MSQLKERATTLFEVDWIDQLLAGHRTLVLKVYHQSSKQEKTDDTAPCNEG